LNNFGYVARQGRVDVAISRTGNIVGQDRKCCRALKGEKKHCKPQGVCSEHNHKGFLRGGRRRRAESLNFVQIDCL
jgi:hypothetical protein